MTTAETDRPDARPDGGRQPDDDAVRRGSERHGSERHGSERHDAVRHDAVHHGSERHDAVRHDAVRHGSVRHDAASHDAVRHASVRHGIALAATDGRQLADATAEFGAPGLTAAPEAHTKPVDAVTWALRTAFEALPEAVRSTAPLYVLCGAYSSWAARHFVGRCHDTGRRLRPSDSIGLETSELVRPYTTASGHRGGCYLLAPLPVDTREPKRATDPPRPPWPLAAMPGPAVHLDLFVSPCEGPRPVHCLAIATAWSVTCP
ncbi:hypothetical protein CP973_38420 [Streptomyces albofaciens JCM 4342]|uniref:hypothetical protein n=1 Tax=Streptomyces albofaciens TaxID=66866 RepID=UPI00123A1E97|nr:hypothetical protein [Streptomyces albofaciens]KAA6214897.1 hypothetical protein CP973_38420 [Streptomyces albofaciens JCM 4342]